MNNTPSMPNLTPAQIVSAIAAVVGLLVSQGLVDNNTEKLITGIASIVIPLIITAADAIIRHGRAGMHGQIQAAKVAATNNPTVVTPPQ